jgi:hypothetical protein
MLSQQAVCLKYKVGATTARKYARQLGAINFGDRWLWTDEQALKLVALAMTGEKLRTRKFKAYMHAADKKINQPESRTCRCGRVAHYLKDGGYCCR